MAKSDNVKLREPEARTLVLQIAATFPDHRASAADIKKLVPKFRDLSDADLVPSTKRKGECMWQQIVGNALASHHKTTVSIFARGLAAKTKDGIRVTEKGIAVLKGLGRYK